jgi:hypothetical protein
VKLATQAVPQLSPTRPPSPAPPSKLPLYFINAPVDYALIGGLSIVTFVLVRAFYVPERTNSVYLLGAQLLWVCNWPHFAATSYRLYHSRDNIMQYPMTALVTPWLIGAAVIGSLIYPTLVAPYFVKMLLIWSPYHFSGQSVGITLIYARRAGFQVGKWERMALSGFIFGTFVCQTVGAEVNPDGSEFYGIKYPGLGLPEWLIPVSKAVMWGAGAAFLYFAVRWSIRNKRMLPPIVLLPAVTQYVWFVYSAETGWRSFQEFVPFFHSLQYLLIAWAMQLKEKMDLKHIAPSPFYVGTETLRWWGLNMIVGAFLFWVLPRLVALCLPIYYDETRTLALATGVIVTGIQIHHFFVDGVIWKLKRKTVSSPLMVNIEELIRPAPILRGQPA